MRGRVAPPRAPRPVAAPRPFVPPPPVAVAAAAAAERLRLGLARSAGLRRDASPTLLRSPPPPWGARPLFVPSGFPPPARGRAPLPRGVALPGPSPSPPSPSGSRKHARVALRRPPEPRPSRGGPRKVWPEGPGPGARWASGHRPLPRPARPHPRRGASPPLLGRSAAPRAPGFLAPHTPPGPAVGRRTSWSEAAAGGGRRGGGLGMCCGPGALSREGVACQVGALVKRQDCCECPEST